MLYVSDVQRMLVGYSSSEDEAEAGNEAAVKKSSEEEEGEERSLKRKSPDEEEGEEGSLKRKKAKTKEMLTKTRLVLFYF